METVTYVAALVLAGLTALLISLVGAGTIERAIGALSMLVGGWRPDPWPRGVQEEDRDHPWGTHVRRAPSRLSAAHGIDELVGPVPVRRIRPHTRAR